MSKRNVGVAQVVRRRDVSHNLFKLWLQPDREFNFKPGQYCTIGLNGIERPYSISSSPSEPQLELFVETLEPPLGQLTPRLNLLRVGDTVSLRPRAKGLFTFKPDYRNHVMISTTTGVAPYISMLRYLADQPAWSGYSFHLLQGASYSDEFGYEQELEELAAAHPNVHYRRAVSRPQDRRNAGWDKLTGRVNEWAMDYIRAIRMELGESLVYACGHPLMVEDVRRRCARMEIRMLEERFWATDG